MTFDRIRFAIAAPFFVTGFFLLFASMVIMAGFITASFAVYRLNQMLGPDDAPFIQPPTESTKECPAPSTK